MRFEIAVKAVAAVRLGVAVAAAVDAAGLQFFCIPEDSHRYLQKKKSSAVGRLDG
jgi:hypothetical protein